MELDQELFNLGKALAQLPIKQDQLKHELAQDRGGLGERVSFLHGVIEGKSQAGDFNKVIELGYACPGKGMILDKEAYHEQILQAARNQTEKKVFHLNSEPLWDQEQHQLLINLGLALPLNYESSDSFFAKLRHHMSPEQKQASQSALGYRAIESSGNIKFAYEHFENANDEEGMWTLYDHLLEHDPVRSRKTLINIAQVDPDTQQARYQQIAKRNIEVGDHSEYYFKTEELLSFILLNKLDIEENDLLELRERMISNWSFSDLKKHGSEYNEEWALLRREQFPRDAYRLFKEIEGHDEERLDTLAKGLWNLQNWGSENKGAKIPLEESTPEDLLNVYDRFTPDYEDEHYNNGIKLRLQLRIAQHLDDKDKMQEIARGFNRIGNKKEAYHAWIESEAPLDDRFIVDVKYDIITQEEGKVHASFLAEHDTYGWGEADLHAGAVDLPFARYAIRATTSHVGGLDLARKKIVQVDPIRALEMFQGRNGSLSYPRDEVGIDMALEALSTQYEVPKETLMSYFVQPEVAK